MAQSFRSHGQVEGAIQQREFAFRARAGLPRDGNSSRQQLMALGIAIAGMLSFTVVLLLLGGAARWEAMIVFAAVIWPLAMVARALKRRRTLP